jgi:hypothetical protein
MLQKARRSYTTHQLQPQVGSGELQIVRLLKQPLLSHSGVFGLAARYPSLTVRLHGSPAVARI